MPELRYIDAIRRALQEEMENDESIVILGEDVTLGGPFGATTGLADKFGVTRVRNTPISEGAVMGMAVGASLVGLRPIVEIMFVDFITLAMDQLVNHAAKLHYMSGGQLRVPLTVRVQGGISGGYGAHHSQSLEAWFLHVPGLKVVAPATASDAAGLLKSAIRDDNPVLFLEHRALYWTGGEVGEVIEPIIFGRAAIRRAGTDATVVAVSRMVPAALEAAERLEESGTSIEVIDPRTLAPLDLDTILESVRRTGRLVVAHEAVTVGGIGGEIAAQVQEVAFADLTGPVLRVGAPFAPVASSPVLEKLFAPGVDAIVDAVQRSLAFSRDGAPA